MTRKFVTEKIARKLAGIRKTHGMLPGLAVPDEDFMDIDIDEDVPGIKLLFIFDLVVQKLNSFLCNRCYKGRCTQFVYHHRKPAISLFGSVSV